MRRDEGPKRPARVRRGVKTKGIRKDGLENFLIPGYSKSIGVAQHADEFFRAFPD